MKSRRLGFYLLTPFAAGTSALTFLIRFPTINSGNILLDSDDELFTIPRKEALAQLPVRTLLRSLFVHSVCAHPRLVDMGITLIKARQNHSIPIFDTIIRQTFFAHFCGYTTSPF